MHYDSDIRDMMIKTARAGGAVGSNAVLPRIVETMATKDDRILDYGSGPKAIHTMALREKGFLVMAHDINPVKSPLHIDAEHFWQERFDIAFASNVINVQPSAEHIREMIEDVNYFVVSYGIVLFNYPASPRKSGLTVADIDDILRQRYPAVERVTECDGNKLTSPVWKCKKGL